MSNKLTTKDGGGRRGRPGMLSIGMVRNVGGGGIIPTDPGDGMDDGAKFRDLVWMPDDEKVRKYSRKVPPTHRPCRRCASAVDNSLASGLLLLLLFAPVAVCTGCSRWGAVKRTQTRQVVAPRTRLERRLQASTW